MSKSQCYTVQQKYQSTRAVLPRLGLSLVVYTRLKQSELRKAQVLLYALAFMMQSFQKPQTLHGLYKHAIMSFIHISQLFPL